MLRKLILTATLLVVAMYTLNGLFLAFSQPGNLQAGEPERVSKSFGDFNIVVFDELQSGGVSVLGLSIEAAGYVNMLSPDKTVYINEGVAGSFSQKSYLYQHESAHVFQKEIIAEASGGYPSFWNPIQSFVYYANLVKLNNQLREWMPATDPEKTHLPFTDGLEAAAECYAQPPSSEEEQIYYDAPYLKEGYCNAEQRRLAISLISGTWPDPLTAEEKASLEPVNITTEPPARSIGNLSKFTKTVESLVEELTSDK